MNHARKTVRGRAAAVALAAAAALVLTSCSGGEGDNLASQWQEASDKGYIAGDGSTASIPIAERGKPVVYSGVDEYGKTFGSDDTIGTVTVVNFWYAGCAPCRAEAPMLSSLDAAYSDDEVRFVGVNVRDGADQAIQFAEQFSITYPSIMDNASQRAVQLAFAGQIPLNAVPTTLVLDREGRVAHRILGQIADESILRTLVTETLAES